MMKKKVTMMQAYIATFKILEKYYAINNSDDIAMILSDMQLLPSGKSADPAFIKDWEKALVKALEPNALESVTIKLK